MSAPDREFPSQADEFLRRAIATPATATPTPPRDPAALRRFNQLWKR